MKKHHTLFRSSYIFDFFNLLFLSLLALSCLLPFVNVMSISLSDSAKASSGIVGFWPVEFTLSSYQFAFMKPRFITSMLNSIIRVVVGLCVNLLLTILVAYPLSKNRRQFPGRTGIAWFFVLTMLIGVGLIPRYLTVVWTGLRGSFWSLIIPGAVPIWYVLILLNFFRSLPGELEESATLDGAGHWRILFQIFVPLSMPCIASLIVFISVDHWNEWLSGAIFLDQVEQYPLATYLHNVLKRPSFDNMDVNQLQQVMKISSRTLQSAQIMMGAIPIIMVYPFLQRYFVKGLTLGGLKG